VAQTRFRVDGHWLELFGLCARCQQEHHPLT
jgi:Fe2+ or Zn2+ uptake regulation protein